MVSNERLRLDRKSCTLSHSLYTVFGFGKRCIWQLLAVTLMCVFAANASSAGLP